MKNLVFVLLALLAVPAFAVSTMTVDVVDNLDGTGTVRLTDFTGAPPVGIGLVVDANDGADGDAVVDVTAPDGGSFFNVYIDYYSMPTTTTLTDNDFSDDLGTPGANPAIAGVLTAGSEVSLSMGELDDVNNADDMILPIELAIVDLGGAGDFTINVDTFRGGIVDVNLGEVELTNAGATFAVTDGPVDCLKDTDPGHTTWVAFGKPDCWCYRLQCKGDTNGTAQLSRFVSSSDLTLFKTAYNVRYADLLATNPGGICADFNHTSQLGRPVSSSDLTVFKQYYNQRNLTDCDMTNINFWTN